METDIIYGLIIGIILILLWKFYNSGENYETKKEKAETIYNWWNSAVSPTYNSYKSDIANSDIVEYYGSKKLKKSGNLSVDNIMNVIK